MWIPPQFPQNLLFLITITRSPKPSKPAVTGRQKNRLAAGLARRSADRAARGKPRRYTPK